MLTSHVPSDEVPLAEAPVMALAEQETGLSDWGPDPSFRVGLRVLIDAIEAMNPSVDFRTNCHARIHHILKQRLHLRDDEVKHPEIVAASIKSPLVITGLPRSGTTVTYDLLALAPDSRAPREWECFSPWPAPEVATFDTDPRIAALNSIYAHILDLVPDFSDVQRLDGAQPGECNHIFMMHFAGLNWSADLSVPKHREWMLTQRAEGMYPFHKRCLQQLQWKGPKGRWIIKSPNHMFDLPDFLETYPDASVVWTHRDPVSTMSSLSSMVAMLQTAFGISVDPKQIGANISEMWITGLLRGVEARRDPKIESRMIDVSQRDVVADPKSVVQRIHEQLGIPFTGEHAENIDRFLSEAAGSKRLGRHKHNPKTYGIDPDDVRRRLGPYFERFGHLTEGSVLAGV